MWTYVGLPKSHVGKFFDEIRDFTRLFGELLRQTNQDVSRYCV